MWLINTTTLELHEFIDAEHAPPYAILSHCWGDEEVSFRDFRKKRNLSGSGYRKILDCCEFAKHFRYNRETWANHPQHANPDYAEGIQWVWVDTVCIDKRSSAELTEAINSMYSWYYFSPFCFAHLADVSVERRDEESIADQLRRSRWFTRGWTLQELIAPADVVFVDRDWNVIGTKKPIFINADRLKGAVSLTREIASITRIPIEALGGVTKQDLASYSVAERMSWASRRHSTRLEDVAYCLLGIFNVNMPLLYGEGRNAFRRLQEELLQRSGDSILAWTPGDRVTPWKMHGTGMLARSPAAFVDSGSVVDTGVDPGWSLSRQSRDFELHVSSSERSYALFQHKDETHYLLRLQCSNYNLVSGRHEPCVMMLQQTDCGHMRRVFDASIFAEYDIQDPQQYTRQKNVDVLHVHSSEQDYLQCKRRLTMHTDRSKIWLPLDRAQDTEE